MASRLKQDQLDQLFGQISITSDQLYWPSVRSHGQVVLALDAVDPAVVAFLSATESVLRSMPATDSGVGQRTFDEVAY